MGGGKALAFGPAYLGHGEARGQGWQKCSGLRQSWLCPRPSPSDACTVRKAAVIDLESHQDSHNYAAFVHFYWLYTHCSSSRLRIMQGGHRGPSLPSPVLPSGGCVTATYSWPGLPPQGLVPQLWVFPALDSSEQPGTLRPPHSHVWRALVRETAGRPLSGKASCQMSLHFGHVWVLDRVVAFEAEPAGAPAPRRAGLGTEEGPRLAMRPSPQPLRRALLASGGAWAEGRGQPLCPSQPHTRSHWQGQGGAV